jgi:hypothetical protein
LSAYAARVQGVVQWQPRPLYWQQIASLIVATMPVSKSNPPSTPPDSSFGSGLLGELAREVQRRDEGSEHDPQALERNRQLVNRACRVALDYWTQLTEHLNTLTPTSPGRYAFDGRTTVSGLPMKQFRAVHKSVVQHNGVEQFESVMLTWHIGRGDKLTLVKDFPPDLEKLRTRLRFAGIRAHEAPVHNRDTGRQHGTSLECAADVVANVRLVPLHDSGRVRLVCQNLDALERIEGELPAFAIRAKELDELSKWILGRPSEILKIMHGVLRAEP